MNPNPCWNTEDDMGAVKFAYMALNALLKPACMVLEPATDSEASLSEAGI